MYENEKFFRWYRAGTGKMKNAAFYEYSKYLGAY